MGYRHIDRYNTPCHNLNKNECCSYRPIVKENFHIFSKGQCENTFICESLGFLPKDTSKIWNYFLQTTLISWDIASLIKPFRDLLNHIIHINSLSQGLATPLIASVFRHATSSTAVSSSHISKITFPSKIRLELDIRSSLKVVFYSVLDVILRPFLLFLAKMVANKSRGILWIVGF